MSKSELITRLQTIVEDTNHNPTQLVVHINEPLLINLYLDQFMDQCIDNIVDILTLLIEQDNFPCFSIVFTRVNDYLRQLSHNYYADALLQKLFYKYFFDKVDRIIILLEACIQNPNIQYWQLVGSYSIDFYEWFLEVAETHDKVSHMKFLKHFDFINFIELYSTNVFSVSSFKTLYYLAPVNIQDINFEKLAYFYDLDIFKFVLDRGYQVSAKNMANAVGLELVSLLHPLLTEKTPDILNFAVENDDLDTVKFLLAHKYPLDKYILIKAMPFTPLYDDIWRDITRLLVDAGCYTGPEIIDTLLNKNLDKDYIMHCLSLGCQLSDNAKSQLCIS